MSYLHLISIQDVEYQPLFSHTYIYYISLANYPDQYVYNYGV